MCEWLWAAYLLFLNLLNIESNYWLSFQFIEELEDLWIKKTKNQNQNNRVFKSWYPIPLLWMVQTKHKSQFELQKICKSSFSNEKNATHVKRLTKALQSSFSFKYPDEYSEKYFSGRLKYNSLKLNLSLAIASCSPSDTRIDTVLPWLTQFLHRHI